MVRKEKQQVIQEILDAYIACKREAPDTCPQISQIAARACMSTRTLNRYFPVKEQLIYNAAQSFLHFKYQEIAGEYSALDLSGLNGLECLLRFFSVMKAFFQNDPTNATMMVDATISCLFFAIDKYMLHPLVGGEVKELLVSALKKGEQDGSIRPGIDPWNACVLISASFNGLMQRLTFLYRGNASMEEKQRIFQIFDEYIGMLRRYLSV